MFDSAPLPGDVVLTQRAAAVLRTYLSENDLGHFRIFHCGCHDLYDIEWFLAATRRSRARVGADAALHQRRRRDRRHRNTTTIARQRFADSGILRLANHEVVIGRWHWIDHEGGLGLLNLFAAHRRRTSPSCRRNWRSSSRRERGGLAVRARLRVPGRPAPPRMRQR